MKQLRFTELYNLNELITFSHSFLLVRQSNPLYRLDHRRFLNVCSVFCFILNTFPDSCRPLSIRSCNLALFFTIFCSGSHDQIGFLVFLLTRSWGMEKVDIMYLSWIIPTLNLCLFIRNELDGILDKKNSFGYWWEACNT